MFGLLVGVELGVEFAVRVFARGGEMGVGLAVRDFEGGGGRGGPGFEVGMGGSGFAGRPWERSPRPRPEDCGSVGERFGEIGDSDPLAVFALRLEPPDEGAESRFGFFGEPPELRDGYGESKCKLETKELLGEPRVGTSFKTRPESLLRSSVPLRPWSCRYFGLVN